MHRQILTLLTIFLAMVAAGESPLLPASAKSYDVGIEDESQLIKAKATYAPEPKIPASLQEECLTAYCNVRFNIAQDGKATVKLLSSSGSEDIDDITLKTLKQWQFQPATLDGKPVASTRKIKVEFQID